MFQWQEGCSINQSNKPYRDNDHVCAEPTSPLYATIASQLGGTKEASLLERKEALLGSRFFGGTSPVLPHFLPAKSQAMISWIGEHVAYSAIC